MTQVIENLSEISHQYDALFCDLWGCLHNGIAAFPKAVAALQAFRGAGGAVILVTNAPRQRAEIYNQLQKLGVPDDAWDSIATSGDSARLAMFQGAVGNKIHFIGEERDQMFFAPLGVAHDPIKIEQVPLDQATGIVCCGPEDPTAHPSVYRAKFLMARELGLKLLCANPDIVVDRGETREWCAGALAKLYQEMGGEALYFGKPHPPIYDLAKRRLQEVGRDIENAANILCIGDGILTDVAGAHGENMDCLFVTGGLAASDTGTKRQPEAQKLDAFLNQNQISPRYSIGFLR